MNTHVFYQRVLRDSHWSKPKQQQWKVSNVDFIFQWFTCQLNQHRKGQGRHLHSKISRHWLCILLFFENSSQGVSRNSFKNFGKNSFQGIISCCSSVAFGVKHSPVEETVPSKTKLHQCHTPNHLLWYCLSKLVLMQYQIVSLDLFANSCQPCQ